MSSQEGKTRAKVFECNESLDELVLIKFITQVKKNKSVFNTNNNICIPRFRGQDGK